jgi:hypothetical protein
MSTLQEDPEDLEETDRRSTIASALVVGGSASFVGRCRDVLTSLHVIVWNCGLESFATLAKSRRPPIIIVTNNVFAADPVVVTEIATSLGSRIVRISNEALGGDALAALLTSVVAELHASRK